MATSKYGVTVNGFVRKRLQEVKTDLETNLESAWGVPVSTKANSTIGQAVGVFAAALDDLWQLAEDTYNAMYPNTAEGISLRNSVGFAGVSALNAAKTKIYEVCYGTPGTIITKGAQIQDSLSNYYEAYIAAAISLSNAVTLSVTLNTVTAGATYSITIAGTPKAYTANASDAVTTVLVALSTGLPTGWTASVTNNVLTIMQAARINGAVVSASTNLMIESVGSPVIFYAAETGVLDPAIGTVNNIITQIEGWTRAANESAAYPGRDVETDTELRQRYSSTVSAQGMAMVESIKANLLENVSGVTAAVVFENAEDITDSDGRPPHSIEAVVQGGDDEEVAKMIWRKKAPVTTFGSTSVIVNDSQGIPHTIRFSRPTAVPIYLKCVVYEHAETGLAGDALQTIAALLLAQGQAFEVGQDVILQKLGAYTLQNVAGIGYLELTGSTDGRTYSATNIAIGARALASFASSRIEVSEAS